MYTTLPMSQLSFFHAERANRSARQWVQSSMELWVGQGTLTVLYISNVSSNSHVTVLLVLDRWISASLLLDRNAT